MHHPHRFAKHRMKSGQHLAKHQGASSFAAMHQGDHGLDVDKSGSTHVAGAHQGS
ncbi:hypothetical protein K2Q08_00930 [Patescibacteria group bacterium]|nr:hypothetical protein [Patescibacteria group bacterium]